jgi:hypothetical protein
MDIHQIVKDCLHIPCKLSQIMGVLPFSFDKVNRIQFSFRNLPSLFFFLFMSITIPWSIFYSSIFDEIVKIMAKSLPDKSRSTTETVSMGLILNILNFSGIIIRLVTIQQRYKIINFYEEFNSVLPEIFNPSCSLGHPHKETILGWFRDAKQSLKWAWYCMAAIQVLILPFPVAIAQADLNETFSKFRVAIVAGLVLNGVYDSLYHIIIFWLVSIINCITIAYKTLNLELTETIYCASRPSPYQKNGSAVPSTHLRLQENTVLRFLVNQRRLEQLVHKFNHTFMYQISIILGIHFVGLTLHSFSIIAAVVEGFGLQTLGLVAMMLPLGFSEWNDFCISSCRRGINYKCFRQFTIFRSQDPYYDNIIR